MIKLIALAYRKTDDDETRKLKTKSREVIVDGLRRKGNYVHNVKVLEDGVGELVVKKCPVIEVKYSMYLPCEFFFEFYFRPDLHRHMKRCSPGLNWKRVEQVTTSAIHGRP